MAEEARKVNPELKALDGGEEAAEHARLVAACRELMRREGLSQAAAAREIGISGATFNQWLRGAYKGDVRAVNAAVATWLAARERRARMLERLPDAPAWVETPTAARVIAALAYAQMAQDIAVIYGGAGVGKTVAARRYATTAPNVWLITITPATAGLVAALERIADAVGVRASGLRAAKLEAEIVDRIRGSGGLIVVDEAQHLAPRALEAVRALHDASGVGLALMGNEMVWSRIAGGRRQAEFAQLFSRVGKRVRLVRPGERDVQAMLDAWGVQDAEARALLAEIAGRPGALRMLTKTLRLAAMATGGKPDLKAVRAAWRDLGGV